MNVQDKSKASGQSTSTAPAFRDAQSPKQPAQANQAPAGEKGAKADKMADAPLAAHVAHPPAALNLQPPATGSASGASRTDAHQAMDAAKSALVAQLARGGSLRDAASAAVQIAEMHGKPRHADEVCAMADRIIDDPSIRDQVKLAASLVVLGEWKSPVGVMLGGRLSDEDKRAHIFPINKRAADVLRTIEGGESLAQAIEGSSPQGVTPWLHASRDISAMDAPRKWRQDDAHPDGRLSLQEIRTELEKNNERPGRDAKVTAALLARYETLRGEVT